MTASGSFLFTPIRASLARTQRRTFQFSSETEDNYNAAYSQLAAERAKIVSDRTNGHKDSSALKRLSRLMTDMSNVRAYAKIRGFAIVENWTPPTYQIETFDRFDNQATWLIETDYYGFAVEEAIRMHQHQFHTDPETKIYTTNTERQP